MAVHVQLCSDFNPCPMLPPMAIKTFRFPGGEQHVRLETSYKPNSVDALTISTRIGSSEDLVQVLLVVDALSREGFKTADMTLLMPYLPYARQDRVCSRGECFSLKVFANLINSLQLGKVIVVDAHSDVGPALIDRCENIPNHAFVAQAIARIDRQNLVLVSPDSGASKKINKLSAYLGGIEVVNCDKTRDVVTGNLTGFKVFAHDLTGKNCLIVDDICDGGRTFVGIAEALHAKSCMSVDLFVTHGIFSAGFGFGGLLIDNVLTTNSVQTIKCSDIVQFPITLMEIK